MSRWFRQALIVAAGGGVVALLRLALAGNGAATVTLEGAVALLIVLGAAGGT